MAPGSPRSRSIYGTATRGAKNQVYQRLKTPQTGARRWSTSSHRSPGRAIIAASRLGEVVWLGRSSAQPDSFSSLSTEFVSTPGHTGSMAHSQCRRGGQQPKDRHGLGASSPLLGRRNVLFVGFGASPLPSLRGRARGLGTTALLGSDLDSDALQPIVLAEASGGDEPGPEGGFGAVVDALGENPLGHPGRRADLVHENDAMLRIEAGAGVEDLVGRGCRCVGRGTGVG